MKRIISGEYVIDADFPYKREDIDNNPDILKQFCFVPLDPTLTEDGYCMVFDYDGFIEWFPEWNAMYREDADEDWYKDNEGAEYLRDNLFKTVDVVKVVEA